MENKNILFTIITVSFNSAQTIEKTILSVINQTYDNIEYIIIDGGSTDGTINIIEKYKDKISYWISESDEGISDAFNKGILASNGDIIGIVNSDDWYEPTTVQTVVDFINENNADIFVGSLRYWDNYNKSYISYPAKNYKRTISFRMPHLNHPSSFFKKEVYKEVGLFNPKYKYAMDYDLFLRAYMHNKKIYFTEEILSNMRIGGVANQSAEKAYGEVLTIAKNKILGSLWYVISILRKRILKLLK